MWSQILVIFSTLLALFIFFKRIHQAARLINMFVLIPLLLIALTFLASSELDLHIYLIIRDWSLLISATFALTILLKIIRDLKPVFERYPAPFIYTPLILLPVYPFLNDAEVIKNLLNIIFQGGALIVFILITATVIRKIESAWTAIIMVTSLISTYSLYWFVPDINEIYPWIWHLLLSAGLLTCSLYIPVLLNISTKHNSGATL